MFSTLRRWFQGAVRAPQTDKKPHVFKPRIDVLEERVVPAWSVKDLTVLQPLALAQQLAGPGTKVSNVQYQGAPISAGYFTDTGKVTGLKSGVVLSSGSAKAVGGPNTSTGIDNTTGFPGDSDLNTLIAPSPGFDAAVLEFDFVPKGNLLVVKFVWGSDEYPEFVGVSADVFGMFVNGKNAALVPKTTLPITIDSINPTMNAGLYKDNETNPNAFKTEMDGFTKVLSVVVNVNKGASNHIKLAIQDGIDSFFDSWVLIKAKSLSAPTVKGYAPLRWRYNGGTGLYTGTVSIVNSSNIAIPAPLYLLFTNVPAGVTITNLSKSPSGKPYLKLNGLSAHKNFKFNIVVRNPNRLNLGTFFRNNGLQLVTSLT